MSNHLINETSPYLLQHAENPVSWYPWCEEAFEKAKREDKPIFLSIGYSTCHWCHVMAHESFEDRTTAAILNRYFISVKVDREERPDIDSVYMTVCQTFTGSGGWPMSIFMTWDKKPFLAGTYFPVYAEHGMPGFSDLLRGIANQWSNDREMLLHSADEVVAHLKRPEFNYGNADSENLCAQAVQLFSGSFDNIHGGFGDAPKFPMPHNLFFLLLYAAQNEDPDVLKIVEKTLTQMRKGGIYDHVGYGFSRYSTDKYFLVPHFEKMLYDNALLIIAYASAYAVTKNQLYLDTAEKTAQYVLREMTASGGGFYSAQDADIEGVEGKYYTFTFAEIMEVLGKEKGEQFSRIFDITLGGNFEGFNIPNLLKSNDLYADFEEEIQKLYDYRKKRFTLHIDDKILMSWNALMIAALSVLYRVSRNEKYLLEAVNAQIFLEENVSRGLCLFASWREGKASEKGFLDDYAFYIAALTELYHATLNKEYLEKAERFCQEAVGRFADDINGGFYLADGDSAELFMNPKEIYDGAVPSGNGVMTYNFVRLYQLTEKEEYRQLAQKQISYMTGRAKGFLTGHGMFLFAKFLYDNPPANIIVALKERLELENIREQLPFLANVTVVSESEEYPLVNDMTTFYVCKGHVCLEPSNTLSL